MSKRLELVHSVFIDKLLHSLSYGGGISLISTHMNAEFYTLYLTNIKRAWDMEDQLVRALPKMAEQATSKMLHDSLAEHLEETKTHRDHIGNVLALHDELESSASNPGLERMLEEAESEMTAISDFDVRDAHIISAGRAVEHLEIATYDTLIDWSSRLEDTDAETIFREIRNEEDAAERKLATIATGGLFGLMGEAINEKASV